MIKIKFLLIVMIIPVTSMAQKGNLTADTYDFWLGDWQAEWRESDSTMGYGTNHIFKVLDGAVIEENFEITAGNQAGFKGKSLSVFNQQQEQWHQAWTDNQGGYIDLIGEVDGDKKIFKTKPLAKDGKVYIRRMVFYEIKVDSFTWDWESSADGGKTWQLNWRIHYTKK